MLKARNHSPKSIRNSLLLFLSWIKTSPISKQKKLESSKLSGFQLLRPPHLRSRLYSVQLVRLVLQGIHLPRFIPRTSQIDLHYRFCTFKRGLINMPRNATNYLPPSPVHGGVVNEPPYWISLFLVNCVKILANQRGPIVTTLPYLKTFDTEERTAPSRGSNAPIWMRKPTTSIDWSTKTGLSYLISHSVILLKII